ncbi:MAG: TlpA family protein disulfide reductase [Helicobacteraceae bacterium]|jgi:thiol-disulfide isomerase/thioredoxin|nr:TlpA family protein disulfide reductase [Helicobacteraceae bacterium]
MLARTFIFIFTIAFFALGCTENRASIASAKNGFELKLLNGELLNARIEPSEGRFNNVVLGGGDKPVLYAFFTTVCPECAKEIPHLIDIKRRYGDQIELIGVLVENKTADEVSDFAAFHQINYSIALGAGAFRLADAVGGVRSIPAVHIYDKDGKYVSHFVGLAPQEMLETRINEALKIN